MSSAFSNKSSDPRLQCYSFVRQVGKGSYGEVFLVRHTKEKKQYVMKNIKLTASRAKERSAAEQEAVLLGQLKHPNIVSYKESFQDEHGMLHIVMGYCEGGDLCTRLKSFKGSYLPETQVVEWFVQIALGLQYLHERNILHRDLKTQNIFLSKNDIIKVGDLGIARVLDGSCDLAHTVIGTPYYMSPELFANEPYNHKSDIWALGCCVYEMATLQHAFTANNINALMYKIVKGTVPSLPTMFSSELSALVKSMMAHRANDRPTVQQLLRNPFVRRHIKLFLERAASKKKKNSSRSSTNAPPPEKPEVVVNSAPSTKDKSLAVSPAIRARSISTGSSPQVQNSQQKGKQSDSANKAASLSDLSQEPPIAVEPSPVSQAPLAVKEPSPTGNEPSSAAMKPPPSVDKQPSIFNKPSLSKPVHPKQTKSEPKLSTKEKVAKKPPRPLPPDPSVRSVISDAVGIEKKSSPKVSSARERRRRSKQLEGGGVKGRVVLKSRSSSDVSRNSRSTEDLTKHAASDTLESNQQRPSNIGSSNNLLVVDSSHDLPSVDSSHDLPGVDSSHDLSSVDSSHDLPSVDSSHDLPNSGSSHDLPSSGSSHDLPSSGSAHEVDEFLTLLDTTLYLPEPAVITVSDTPAPRQAFVSEQVSNEDSEAMLQSGRLGDRIIALRRECVLGLGEPLMKEAGGILHQHEPEEAEELLLQVLGQKQFDQFAAKLQHLNFCEDNVKTF